MDTILVGMAVSMYEFKKNPGAVLRAANNRPVAVLNHDRAAFYVVEPALFKAMLEELADQDLHRDLEPPRGEVAGRPGGP